MNPENPVLILRELLEDLHLSQRQLAELCDLSLGTVNRTVRYCRDQGLLIDKGQSLEVSDQGFEFLEDHRVRNALILTALPPHQPMPPIYDRPRGLLKVRGTPIVERQIQYLQARGIDSIYLVVGHMKEAFDYLIDKYGVQLIYNPDFMGRNHFSSLYHAAPYLDNSYILTGDCWMEENVFHRYEPISYVSTVYSQDPVEGWYVTTTSAGRVKTLELGGQDCLQLCSPSFLHRDFLPKYKNLLKDYYRDPRESLYFWNIILTENFRDQAIMAKDQTGKIQEFRNRTELRAYDETYWSGAKEVIAGHLPADYQASGEDILELERLRGGHSNLSYEFLVEDQAFVFRMPSEWTKILIDRAQERESYRVLEPLMVTDEIVTFDEESGNRITRYFEGARQADPMDDQDLRMAMEMIRRVHDRQLQVDHAFDLEGKIDLYENLVRSLGVLYFRDIQEQRAKVDALLGLVEGLEIQEVLCHGDYLFANVLFLKNGGIRLIDWEYSAMADPLMDVAMFGIFSFFDRERLELALTYYLGRQAEEKEIFRLYLYAALSGYLWSMWGLYKQAHGFDLAEYPMKMYRYLKDFYSLLQEMEPSLPS